jgi:hypothetical protein
MYKNDVYLETIAADSISYTFTGLTAVTQYDLAVKATNANGDSAEAQLTETTTAEQGATLYESNVTTNSYMSHIYSTPVHSAMQTFTPQTSHSIYKVKLMLRRVGTVPTGVVQVFIYSLNSSLLPVAELCHSATMSTADVATSLTEYTFTFTTQPALTAATAYAIIITCSTGDISNYIGASQNFITTPDAYTGGLEKDFAQASYSNYMDFEFFEYGSDDTLYENQPSMSTSKSVFTGCDEAQTFTPVTTHDIAKVKLYLNKSGSPTGTFKVSIKATDAGGIPYGADLCSVSIDVTTLSTSPTLVTFTFTSTATLTSGITYAIYMTLAGPAGEDNTHLVNVYMKYDTVTDPYAAGTALPLSWYYNPSYFADLYFKEYGDPISGAVLQMNIGDVWREGDTAGVQINIGDVWKTVTLMQVNIGDVWKTVFGS